MEITVLVLLAVKYTVIASWRMTLCMRQNKLLFSKVDNTCGHEISIPESEKLLIKGK